VSFIDVGDGATGGAGDAADHALGAALAEHLAGFRVIGMDDDAIGDIAAEGGIWVSGRVENLGVDAADASFGIACLDGGVGVLSNADTPHGEEAGRGLGVGGAEAFFTSATAEGFADCARFEGDDVHPLSGGVYDVEPLWVVVGMTGLALGGDGGLDGDPV